MLTPVEINGFTFKNGRGYDKKAVEEFRETVMADYEELYRTNIELKDKIALLNEGLSHYKTIETSLQKALVLAEQTADELIKSAHESAENIKQEAKNKAKETILGGQLELEAIQGQITYLKTEYNRYKLQFKQFLQAQQELLDSSNLDITQEDTHE